MLQNETFFLFLEQSLSHKGERREGEGRGSEAMERRAVDGKYGRSVAVPSTTRSTLRGYVRGRQWGHKRWLWDGSESKVLRRTSSSDQGSVEGESGDGFDFARRKLSELDVGRMLEFDLDAPNDSEEKNEFGELDLLEPKAVALCGFFPEECAQFRLLLDEIGGSQYKVLPCDGEIMRTRTIEDTILSEEVDWEAPLDPSSMKFPAPGSPRCIVFCGLPRNEVDIVSAILDESKVRPFATCVVTQANVKQVLGQVVAEAVTQQKTSFQNRQEFSSWKENLISQGHKNMLKRPLFDDDESKETFSDAFKSKFSAVKGSVHFNDSDVSSSSAPAGTTEGLRDQTNVVDVSKDTAKLEKAAAKEDEKDIDPEEEELGKGFYSKPLDLDGVRRELAQSMRDDKVFMDPWHARGLEAEEGRDIMKEEEQAFIAKCASLAEGKESSESDVADLLPKRSHISETDSSEKEEESLDEIIFNSNILKEESSSSAAVSANIELENEEATSQADFGLEQVNNVEFTELSEEQIVEISNRFEDVDLKNLLERYRGITRGNDMNKEP